MEKEKKQELLRTLKFTLFSVSAGVIQILSYTLMVEVFTGTTSTNLPGFQTSFL